MTPEGKALVRAMRLTAGIVGLVALISGVIALGVGGWTTAGMAVAGAAVALFVGLSTQASMFVGLRFSTAALMGLLLGSFVFKAAILVIVVLAVNGADQHKGAFAIPLVVGAVVTLVIDLVVFWRARLTTVTPSHLEEQG